MFFYFCKVLFSDFLQFNGNFVDAQNNSEYRDWAPLKITKEIFVKILFLTIENTDSDLKVHALHYANELLVHVSFPFKNFCKLTQHAETIRKHCLGKE